MNKVVKYARRYIASKLWSLFSEHFNERIDTYLKYRMFNRRHMAIHEMAQYLRGAQVPGDYLEFGVYEGATFSYAYQRMAPVYPNMKFHAFDSFEGLPNPKGIDAVDGYTSNFFEHQFATNEDTFLDNLGRVGADTTRITVTKGWFEETLKPERADAYGIEKIAAAWIDCDLYESTVPVLDFIAPRLSVGSVILFDDWRCFRNLPDFGQQLACREWLEKNPQIKIRELLSFGWHGIAFTVESC